jgi:PAS domain S-box-containing protein
MDTDRNLLFGVLALQAGLIDSPQFIEACLLWTTRKNERLAELLLGRGWIEPADMAHLEYLLDRKIQKHGGDAHGSLAAIPDNLKLSLAALDDDDIQRSLAGGFPPAESQALATIDHVPARADRYRRLCLHATGGIGRVWLAHDSDLGRDVALKELRPERAEQAALAARFLQEAQITGQLEHPGIIPVYELVRAMDGRQSFYTMRFVNGRTLSEAVRTFHENRSAGRADPLELPALLNAFVTVCNTVAYAHSRGVIHRDLKGQNVILGDFGEVIVLDWGLAKRVGRPEGETPVHSLIQGDADADSGYTVQGQALGTPAYMAPEQAAGRLEQIDRRTDVYGLGAILYEILTGEPPFTGPSTDEVLRKVREEDPAPPRQFWPEGPPALEAICLRALAKQPADRPAAAADLALEVQGWQEFERRAAEEALAHERYLLHSLMDTIPDSIYFKDRESRFIRINKALRLSKDFAVSDPSQALGRTDFDFFTEDHARQAYEDEQEIMRTGQPIVDKEEKETWSDGRVSWVSTTKMPLRDPQGRIIGTFGISRDITERKRVEESLRASEERFRSVIAAMQGGPVAELERQVAGEQRVVGRAQPLEHQVDHRQADHGLAGDPHG